LKRFFVILAALSLTASPGTAQQPSCRDFTLGPTLQIDACTDVIGIFGFGTPNYNERLLAFLYRGAAYARRGDKVNATADYQQAIRLSDDSANRANQSLWHNQRCWTRAVAAIDLDVALGECNESLKLRPNYATALDSRGFLYLRLHRYTSALADYEAALKLTPRLPSSLLGRAVAKLYLGDDAGARGDVAAAKAASPGIVEEFTAYGMQ
jgi:tetratricopeptide (TPR) repeat protein